MPRPFSSTIVGIGLELILDPLGHSNVSIGQTPSDFVPATQKKHIG